MCYVPPRPLLSSSSGVRKDSRSFSASYSFLPWHGKWFPPHTFHFLLHLTSVAELWADFDLAWVRGRESFYLTVPLDAIQCINEVLTCSHFLVSLTTSEALEMELRAPFLGEVPLNVFNFCELEVKLLFFLFLLNKFFAYSLVFLFYNLLIFFLVKRPRYANQIKCQCSLS